VGVVAAVEPDPEALRGCASATGHQSDSASVGSGGPTLAELAAHRRLRARDLDVIFVAYGEISRETVALYLKGGPERRRGAAEVAAELTERICACQHHDGGKTTLVAADARRVAFRVLGACVTCPQIRYTVGLLEASVHLRTEEDVDVHFEGVSQDRDKATPANSQVTLALLMRQTGMTFADLDAELNRRGRLLDDDLTRLGQRCMLRRRLQVREGADGLPGS